MASPPTASLPPPSKILCIGRSFRDHAVELGNAVPSEPIFFLKAPSAVIGDGDPIRRPAISREVHHEAEAAVVIGRRLQAADPAECMAAIAAWTALNDVTARDLQRADKGRFTRAKGFDTFCPIAPQRVAPPLDWLRCRIQGLVDDRLVQDAPLSELSWSPGELIAAIAAVMTLLPGDIVSLGTPAGVGPLLPGELVTVRLIDAAGQVLAQVRNPVI